MEIKYDKDYKRLDIVTNYEEDLRMQAVLKEMSDDENCPTIFFNTVVKYEGRREEVIWSLFLDKDNKYTPESNYLKELMTGFRTTKSEN